MVGDDYDGLYPAAALDTEATVEALKKLAADLPDNSFLEFGVGTGRLALAMADQGFDVAGIEGSEPMLVKLKEKPGGERIEVRLGDFTQVGFDRSFSLVALTFNTIFGLPSQEAQIACFRNAARHLVPDGVFVIEAYVLHPGQMSADWDVYPRTIHQEQVELQLSRYDAAEQTVERMMVHLREGGTRLLTVKDRYAWPGELDAIAQIAGLKLKTRRSGWKEEPFTSASRKHVSVYELD